MLRSWVSSKKVRFTASLALVLAASQLPASASPPKPDPIVEEVQALASQGPAKLIERLQLRLDQIEESYYRAQPYLKEFDAALDEAVARGEDLEAFRARIMETKTYPRLQALQALSEDYRRQLTEYYAAMTRMRGTRTRTAPALEAGLAHVENYLKQLPEAARLAQKPLAYDLLEVSDRPSRLKLTLERTLAEMTPEVLARAHRKVDAFAERLDARNTILSRRAEELSAEFARLDALETAAASPVHEPSAGPSGNITGATFPRGAWAFTFDDGPSTEFTPRILDVLARNEAKATFFMVAGKAETLPEVALTVRDAGMDIANHSYSHPKFTNLGSPALEREIKGASDKLEEILGSRPRLFRLPYGAGVSVRSIRERIAAEGLIHVFWTVDTLDWQDRDPRSILARAQKQMSLAKNGGGVILFHDIHPQTVEASRMLLESMRQERDAGNSLLRFVTVQEMVEELNGR